MQTFDPTDAERLDRGWPHLIELGSRSSKKSSAERAAALITRVDPPGSAVWTPAVARAYLRGHGLGVSKPKPAQLAAMDGELDWAEGELASCLGAWLRKDRYWFHFEQLLLAAEALEGASAVIGAVCDWLESATPARWGKGGLSTFFGKARTTPGCVAFLVGFPLLRVGVDAPERERLRSVRDGGPEGSTVRGLLDLVLDGGDAARRHGVRHLFGLHFAGDDPALIREVSATDRKHASLSPRFAWLGGPEVLLHFIERVDAGLPSHYQSRAVDELGIFAVPEVLPLMAALAGKKRTERKALAWFEKHAEFVLEHRAVLEATTNGPEILGMLGAPLPEEPPRLSGPELQVALGKLLRETAAALADGADPVAALSRALTQYTELRAQADLDPDPRAGHFFMLDGTADVGPLPELLELDESGAESLFGAFERVEA